MALNDSYKLVLAKMTLQLWYLKFMNDNLPIILFHSFFFHKSCWIINNEIWTLQNSKNLYIHQVMASNGSYMLILAKIILQLCYQKFMNDNLPIILFHWFFFHKSCWIINNEIRTLQNSKSKYIHQVMACNVSYKLILAKMILQLCYQKLMNDNLPIILFHSFFFHNSYQTINNEIWIYQTSKNQYIYQIMASKNQSQKLFQTM